MKKKRREKIYRVEMDEDEKNDPVIREFLTRDIGGDLKRSGVTPVRIQPPARQQLISIYLGPELKAKLREKAAKRGLGYQTLLKMIVHDHIKEY